jgi:hypothetical protein
MLRRCTPEDTSCSEKIMTLSTVQPEITNLCTYVEGKKSIKSRGREI